MVHTCHTVVHTCHTVVHTCHTFCDLHTLYIESTSGTDLVDGLEAGQQRGANGQSLEHRLEVDDQRLGDLLGGGLRGS